MEQKLSRIQKLRFAVQIKNILKELPKNVKDFIFINPEHSRNEDYSKIYKLIGEKTNINVSTYYYGGNGIGNINISDYITLYFDELEHKFLYGKIVYPEREKLFISKFEVLVSEDLKNKTIKFEENNVKNSGPSNTVIGEIFRALQYIQYRAHNDGDLPWDLNSPTFVSQLYILHKIELLNHTNFNWSENKSGLKYKDETLNKNCLNVENIILDNFEHPLCDDVNYTKFQLIDLLESGQIKNESNDFDSRLGINLKN